MKILSVSDQEIGIIYSPRITQRFRDVDLIIGCGDLPYSYLEFIISMLDRPLYYVRGNHAFREEDTTGGMRTEPWGGIDLHRRAVRAPGGLLLAGMEGSLQYNFGAYQYSQSEMWSYVFLLAPALLLNRLLYGRYLDIFVTHAPPWQIHDQDDLPHRGFKAFRWLIKTFRPAVHLHGHIHVYRQDTITETLSDETRVINTFGYRVMDFTPSTRKKASRSRNEHPSS